MFYNAQYNQIILKDKTMNYLKFGKGKETLVILPGLQDGIAPVHGKLQAIAFAMNYKQLAKHFNVYVFSRQNTLTEGYTTRDMAKDQAEAMNALGISKANVIGVSQGGMISQYLAIDYPDLVKKLVLVVTLSKQNNLFQTVIHDWIEMAKQENYQNLIIDTTEKSYSEKKLKKMKFIYPFIKHIGKPENFNRFLIQAFSCKTHNSYPELSKIVCPTFVIGGNTDNVVGANTALELSEKITDCELLIYDNLGHALYEEAKDFNHNVLTFLLK